jgi:hypothetical protein
VLQLCRLCAHFETAFPKQLSHYISRRPFIDGGAYPQNLCAIHCRAKVQDRLTTRGSGQRRFASMFSLGRWLRNSGSLLPLRQVNLCLLFHCRQGQTHNASELFSSAGEIKVHMRLRHLGTGVHTASTRANAHWDRCTCCMYTGTGIHAASTRCTCSLGPVYMLQVHAQMHTHSDASMC